jgi:PPM family protein phosphatase
MANPEWPASLSPVENVHSSDFVKAARVTLIKTKFDIASATTQGGRSYQEDASAIRSWRTGAVASDPSTVPPTGPALDGLTLVVLADGMGGHAGGEIASRLVCEHMLTGFERIRPSRAARLVAGLEAANTAIASMVARKPALSSMGSTVIACVLSHAGVEWLSVGDSPLYLVRRGEIAQLNADHSLAPVLDQMVADGRMTRAAADVDGRRHMLRSAVSGEEIDMIDTSAAPLALASGDIVILASDGIETLEPAEIATLAGDAASAGESADAIARRLIAAVDARRRPHQDNATVIVAVVA